MSVSKRPRSWEEDFSKQSKMFISERIVIKNSPDKMQEIYGKNFLRICIALLVYCV